MVGLGVGTQGLASCALNRGPPTGMAGLCASWTVGWTGSGPLDHGMVCSSEPWLPITCGFNVQCSKRMQR